eukprot:SM000033S12413  [mRNA]  locus=s33:845676:847824:- [translate_table: standard]
MPLRLSSSPWSCGRYIAYRRFEPETVGILLRGGMTFAIRRRPAVLVLHHADMAFLVESMARLDEAEDAELTSQAESLFHGLPEPTLPVQAVESHVQFAFTSRAEELPLPKEDVSPRHFLGSFIARKLQRDEQGAQLMTDIVEQITWLRNRFIAKLPEKVLGTAPDLGVYQEVGPSMNEQFVQDLAEEHAEPSFGPLFMASASSSSDAQSSYVNSLDGPASGSNVFFIPSRKSLGTLGSPPKHTLDVVDFVRASATTSMVGTILVGLSFSLLFALLFSCTASMLQWADSSDTYENHAPLLAAALEDSDENDESDQEDDQEEHVDVVLQYEPPEEGTAGPRT